MAGEEPVAISHLAAVTLLPDSDMLCASVKVAEPKLHLDPEAVEALDRIMLLDTGDDLADAGGHLGKIDRPGIRGRQAETAGLLHQSIDPGRLDQGLAGHAAEVQAIAAQKAFFFHQQGLRPQLRGAGGHGQAGSPAADNADVVVEAGHISSLRFPPVGAWP